ncbi:hypothetical protein SAMN04487951_12610 [Vreelandella arcis]|uniref:Uncharacterized protein n=1 Tax=Vreelandella arcis TaxID=416873 RepID=A0A1H0JEC3_9GAMM|nr:hypothetical protein SAMN04487951_12610 [Halomonas arcis]
MRSGVGYLGDHRGIAAQHHHLGAEFTVVVVLLEQVAHRAACLALSVLQELDVHDTSVPSSSSA